MLGLTKIPWCIFSNFSKFTKKQQNFQLHFWPTLRKCTSKITFFHLFIFFVRWTRYQEKQRKEQKIHRYNNKNRLSGFYDLSMISWWGLMCFSFPQCWWIIHRKCSCTVYIEYRTHNNWEIDKIHVQLKIYYTICRKDPEMED